jgi:trehalose-6-phosphatase
MLDPKFKYNGKTFSLEAINAKAASKGLSTEDYLKQNPKITKIEDPDFQTPTTPGAVVEETAAPDTDSKSEDPLLELQQQLDAIKPNDPAYNSRETILLRRKLKNLKAERIEKLEEVVVTAPTQKNKEISKTNEIIDDVFEDNELLKNLSGSDNILTLASENMGQIPREIRREISDRLGYDRTVILGEQITDTNEFKALEESDVQDIIKERFQELVNSQKSERYLNSVRDSRKYLYDNKESN